MNVILVSGAKGAGKTTVGALIQKIGALNEVKVVHTNFADFLKHACSLALDIPLEEFFSDSGKERKRDILLTGKAIGKLSTYYRLPLWRTAVLGYKYGNKRFQSIRELLQFVGTDMLRAVDPEIHIKALKATMRASKHTLYVVSDLRFLNERSHFPDALHLHVERLGLVNDDFHVSEQNASALRLLADKVILNPGSLEGLALELYRQDLTPSAIRKLAKIG